MLLLNESGVFFRVLRASGALMSHYLASHGGTEDTEIVNEWEKGILTVYSANATAVRIRCVFFRVLRASVALMRHYLVSHGGTEDTEIVKEWENKFFPVYSTHAIAE